MKKYVILMVSLFFAFSINAQTAEDLFNQKFPEYNGVLNPNGNTKVTNTNISQFRNLYKKLSTALQEIDMFKFGGFPEEGGEIFTSKELKNLKKVGDVEVEKLENLIKVSINDMKLFLGTKNKYGADSIDCIQKYSNFKTRLKQKDYKGASEYWRELTTYYPMSFSGIYSKGDKLIKEKIKTVHNEAAKVGKEAIALYNEKKYDESKVLQEKQKQLLAEKELWIDTLLMSVDNRMKYFGNSKNYGKGYLLGKKGGYIYKYRKDSAFEEAYKYLKQSVEIEKDKTQPLRMKDFFDASMDMTKAGKNGAEDLVNDYNLATNLLNTSIEKLSTYIEKEKAKAKPKEKKIRSWANIIEADKKVSKYITGKFAASDYSKCEYLVPAFQKNFEENKTNADWLEKKLGILKWKECTDNPFFLDAAKALYQLKPSASSAAMIAIGELKKKDYAEAGKYFEEAYNGETEDMDKKAEYYYYGAVVASAQNQKSKARSLALKASSTKENYGKPYLLIARLYAGSASQCGTTKFEKAAVYWAAVDKLVKARAITKDQKVKDEANQFIAKYTNRFPSSEEGFMLGKYEGNSYSIGCWIGETTTVRYKK